MKLIKQLNNNVALVSDEYSELVVFGRGVAFGLSYGDEIDQSRIDKTFRVQQNKDLLDLIYRIPSHILEISQEIIEEGNLQLKVKLADSILFSLSDHICFAVQRYEEGKLVKSSLHWEIKHLYPKEYDIGIWAVQLISEKLKLELPMSEASFIALHLVNGQFDSPQTNEIVFMNNLISRISQIIDDSLDNKIDKQGIDYSRLITHLRYFIIRYQNNKEYGIQDNEFLYDTLKQKYQQSFYTAQQIKTILEEEHHWILNKDEIVCLMIHIERLRMSIEEKNKIKDHDQAKGGNYGV